MRVCVIEVPHDDAQLLKPVIVPPAGAEVIAAVQLNVVPATELGLEIVIAENALPEQIVCVAGAAETVGVGFTVMVKVRGVPLQLSDTGVTVIVATTGVLLVLVAVNVPILPVPLAARPIEVLLFVQL